MPSPHPTQTPNRNVTPKHWWHLFRCEVAAACFTCSLNGACPIGIGILLSKNTTSAWSSRILPPQDICRARYQNFTSLLPWSSSTGIMSKNKTNNQTINNQTNNNQPNNNQTPTKTPHPLLVLHTWTSWDSMFFFLNKQSPQQFETINCGCTTQTQDRRESQTTEMVLQPTGITLGWQLLMAAGMGWDGFLIPAGFHLEWKQYKNQEQLFLWGSICLQLTICIQVSTGALSVG